LKSDREKGLTRGAALSRLFADGENKLVRKKQRGLLVKFFSQFKDFMVIILLIAALISFVTAMIEHTGEYTDPAVILFIVILNAAVGTAQESRAQKALEALKKLSSPHSFVIRDGKKIKLETSDIVRGDILVLNQGDIVPADARIIEESGLKTQESALTGESLPCEKNADVILPENCPVGDRKNMLLSSTVIISGHCKAVVVETGMHTQIGKIAGLLTNEEAPQTPLQKKLAGVSKVLGCVCVLICVLLQASVIMTPSLSHVFKTVVLSFPQWLTVSLLSLSMLFAVEIQKAIKEKSPKISRNYVSEKVKIKKITKSP
ncbi:MAG: HAD-IC family P-type ATPase, partial [Clostridiales bacterium]|nr:HAD-IC family P-type ATPase [Clostridiales bacterium]